MITLSPNKTMIKIEQNTIADAEGKTYQETGRDIAYEAVVYPNEAKDGYVFEKQ